MGRGQRAGWGGRQQTLNSPPSCQPQSLNPTTLSRERPEHLGSPLSLGGQVRISTVGISRLHPQTPSDFLIPGTSPTGQQANLCKAGPEKSPFVRFLGPPCSSQIPPTEAGPPSAQALVPPIPGGRTTEQATGRVAVCRPRQGSPGTLPSAPHQGKQAAVSAHPAPQGKLRTTVSLYWKS